MTDEWTWWRSELFYQMQFCLSAALASGGGPWFDAAASAARDICDEMITLTAITN